MFIYQAYIGLFTVAIIGPFSAHFQIIFNSFLCIWQRNKQKGRRNGKGYARKKFHTWCPFLWLRIFLSSPLPILLNKKICWLPKTAQRLFMDINNLAICISDLFILHKSQNLVLYSSNSHFWKEVNLSADQCADINRYSQLSSLSACYLLRVWHRSHCGWLLVILHLSPVTPHPSQVTCIQVQVETTGFV